MLQCANSSINFSVTDTNRSEERFSRNAETDLVCRLLLEIKKIELHISPPLNRHNLHKNGSRTGVRALCTNHSKTATRTSRESQDTDDHRYSSSGPWRCLS